MPSSPSPTTKNPPPAQTGAFDRYFEISARGSNIGRELRGGLATFFTMAYILVLNPIILGGATDKYGAHLSTVQLVTSTALIAAIMTILMGIVGRLPVALAAGLGINALVAYQIAPRMAWADAMGLVVITGIVLCVLVAGGVRKAVMDAIPMQLKQAIAVGIGLFLAFIGFVDAGFVTRIGDAANTTVPVQLGASGQLSGWPILVFCLGVLLTFALMVRKVKGAILISIIGMTAVAIVIEAIAPGQKWGLTTPAFPDSAVAAPDFGLLGDFSVTGAFGEVTALTVVLLVFTLLLSDFFDTMGTVVAVSGEAGLLDEKGQVPRIGRVLMVDAVASAAGGASSSSSATSYIESAAGVGEGARTGLASVVTGALFAVALFFTPVLTIVPMQAAAPALVVVGFLLLTQVRLIDWSDITIAIPAFLTIAVMPFTYSITNGIGAGFVSYVVLSLVAGKARRVHWLLWVVSALFTVYFFAEPIERLVF
ncbi:NCS2 family permease [Phytomonospora endophytica]|uniref:AGZA family xanthine/uracil permease-like MFS transporter n=1 Tax=Phytomonospora endophytica TaxID=714109 RepID=A0A841FPT0_9ACTN|nr:NCS2 family permease [Phytomonospora endophytica]MBB6035562.1 AGZA family xanthine/uracil permease-like MFS transporter [Phytomonospora endophytica]GIG70075.1 MFS transporter [Phytomonospora endophytica]